MLCPGEIRPLGLGLVVLFLGLPVVPQFQKMVGEPILPGYAGTTADGEMQLVSVKLPVPVGKLVSGGDYLNAIPADSPSSNLIFLQNILSSRKFLVDTGASVSVYPHLPQQPRAPGVGV